MNGVKGMKEGHLWDFVVEVNILLFMMNGVKGTEEGHVWVPTVCQIVILVYIEHTQCLVFRKRLLLK
jgi:hypothetical protein